MVRVDYILMVAVGVIGSNSLLLSPILVDIAQDFSVSAINVAWAITAYNTLTAFSALFLARYIDEWGYRKVLIIAFSCLLFGIGLSAIAWNTTSLIFSQCLAGLGAGVSLPAIYALAPLIAPKGQETKAVGKVLTGWSLALVAGVPIAALLSELFGWQSAYYLLTGLCSLTLFMIFVKVRNLSSPKPIAQTKVTTTRALNIFAPFFVKGAKVLLLMNFLYMASFYGIYSYFGLYLRDIYQINAVEAGYSVLAYGIGFGVASFADPLVDKFGIHRVSGYIFALLSLVYASMYFTYQYPLSIYGICVVWGFFNHLGLSAIITLLGKIQTNIKGQLMGMNSVFTYIGGSVGTVLFGALYTRYGFFLIALVATSAIIFLTMIYVIFVRTHKGSSERNLQRLPKAIFKERADH